MSTSGLDKISEAIASKLAPTSQGLTGNEMSLAQTFEACVQILPKSSGHILSRLRVPRNKTYLN